MVPSHVGIPFNEKAANLVQLAFQDEMVDPGIKYTLLTILMVLGYKANE